MQNTKESGDCISPNLQNTIGQKEKPGTVKELKNFLKVPDSGVHFKKRERVPQKTKGGLHGDRKRDTGTFIRDSFSGLKNTQYESNDQDPTRHIIKASRENWKLSIHLINRRKIRRAVFGFCSFKAPGMDEIFPALLQ